MKTQDYNPSPLEVRFVDVLCDLKDEINKKLEHYSVYKIESNKQMDNPIIDFYLKDNDGDEHELIIKIIQKPDKF
jgi:hypothetical protein